MACVLHQTLSFERPQKAGVAKGAPLSVRMALGRPYARHRGAKIGGASTGVVESRAVQLSRARA